MRFHEERGLLPPPPRTATGRRRCGRDRPGPCHP
ncbi:hypothetical protein ACFYOV_33250 [Streptomyces sp. NPDC005931]